MFAADRQFRLLPPRSRLPHEDRYMVRSSWVRSSRSLGIPR
jgi:hypothetical protein